MKMKFTLLPAITLFLFGHHFLYAQSQDSTFESSVQEVLKLPVVKTSSVLVASNVVTDAEKQPSSVTTITKEQIRTCGGRTLSEVLTLYVPGYFAVEDQDDVIAGFRGLAADNNSKVLLLINGQNMNTEFFFGPPDAILNSPDMEYIERIEVIRGPGSVTLGQGALLGVINIITRRATGTDGNTAGGTVSYGQNAWLNGSAFLQTSYKGLQGFFYASGIRYEGQAMRNEGWIAQQGNQGFAGGKVFDMGHRLKRTDNTTFHGNIQYKGLSVSIMQLNQRRDLYNFYRDREVIGQNMLTLEVGYAFRLHEKVKNESSITVIDDNISLWSLTGTAMGGTAERRYGFKSIFNIDELWKNNRLAVGVEMRQFQMGLPNRENNNYIANVVGSFSPQNANQQLTMVYAQNLNVLSVFAEDFYSISRKIDLFAAIRYDNHPFWGNNLTPRFGAIFSPSKNWTLRGSFQTGFRGAVGLHYSGGYRRDGFLRANNYSEVSGAQIPGESNISSIKPESMSSFEFATTFRKNEKLTVNAVLFYTLVSNVIDVGVIYKDPAEFPMVNVGTDIAGDWNGYWYFKNTPGTFAQAGAEISVSYKHKWINAGGSFSLTRVANATQEQETLAKNAQSMYLATDSDTKNLHYKAFPEQTLRLHAILKPIKKLSISANIVAYSGWYSPIGTKAEGGFILNSGLGYSFTENIEISLIGKNLLNENALYPMNSNAGGPDVSPGTPAWEATSVWAVLRIKL
jgi:outer membrane receptor for ferrienterochelin and colicin